MRKLIVLLCMISLMILAGCGNNSAPDDNSESTNINDTNSENEQVENTENDKANTSSDTSSGTPSGAEEIFSKAAEAMSNIETMNLTGETITETDTMGVVVNETDQMTGSISMNPFVQHVITVTESETNGVTEIEESEMYMTEETWYMKDDSSEEWISMVMGAALVDFSVFMTRNQFDYFASVHDLFEVSEDSDNYFLTYTGSGDEFKRVVFRGIDNVAGEESYEILADIIDEISGTYELTIDKKTFHMVAIKMDVDETMSLGNVKTKSKELIYNEYSDFNKTDEVIVPDDVVENAKSLMDDLEDFENIEGIEE